MAVESIDDWIITRNEQSGLFYDQAGLLIPVSLNKTSG